LPSSSPPLCRSVPVAFRRRIQAARLGCVLSVVYVCVLYLLAPGHEPMTCKHIYAQAWSREPPLARSRQHRSRRPSVCKPGQGATASPAQGAQVKGARTRAQAKVAGPSHNPFSSPTSGRAWSTHLSHGMATPQDILFGNPRDARTSAQACRSLLPVPFPNRRAVGGSTCRVLRYAG